MVIHFPQCVFRTVDVREVQRDARSQQVVGSVKPQQIGAERIDYKAWSLGDEVRRGVRNAVFAVARSDGRSATEAVPAWNGSGGRDASAKRIANSIHLAFIRTEIEKFIFDDVPTC